MFKQKAKKVLAAAFAAGTMASCMLGMSARAASPTVTKTFTFDSKTITCTLYRDSSYAYGTTKSSSSLSLLEVYVYWGSTTAYGSSKNSTSATIKNTSGSGTASSKHVATNSSGATGSQTISGV